MSGRDIEVMLVVDQGLPVFLALCVDPELGRIAYKGNITDERDQAWHRAEFERQLDDPEHRAELARQVAESKAKGPWYERLQRLLTNGGKV